MIILMWFEKEFCLPQNTLTLVRSILMRVEGLADRDLQAFLELFEVGQVEVLMELQKRELNKKQKRRDLTLLVTKGEND